MDKKNCNGTGFIGGFWKDGRIVKPKGARGCLGCSACQPSRGKNSDPSDPRYKGLRF